MTTEDGRVWQAKKCVLATGVRDLIPQQLAPFWGKGVWVRRCGGWRGGAGLLLGAAVGDPRCSVLAKQAQQPQLGWG